MSGSRLGESRPVKPDRLNHSPAITSRPRALPWDWTTQLFPEHDAFVLPSLPGPTTPPARVVINVEGEGSRWRATVAWLVQQNTPFSFSRPLFSSRISVAYARD